MHAHNQWVDARPKGRFDGTAPEPDKTLHSGHVLGTTNIPFYDMIDSQTKILKDKAGLQQGTKISNAAILYTVSILSYDTTVTIVYHFIHLKHGQSSNQVLKDCNLVVSAASCPYPFKFTHHCTFSIQSRFVISLFC